ncbi:MAG: D-amino acid aminotransferase [Tepidisphaeraceae bacterium]
MEFTEGGAVVEQLIWFNGEVLPLSQARVGVEDRGFQFADGVYEVLRLYNGRPFTLREHMERLGRSCEGIKLALPINPVAVGEAIREFIPRNGVRDGIIYLQATRGVAPRNHVFPKQSSSTLLFYAKPLPPVNEPGEGEGIKLLAVEDDRWKRCWIKSIGLIGHVLAKNEAVEKGCDEAAFVERGLVSECSTSNLFAVLGGKLITHPVGSRVLPGITRLVVLECAAKLNLPVEERPLREEEVLRADELFITSTTREIAWVARWNERYIGQGKCGPITIKLHRAVRDRVRAETSTPLRAAG